MPDPKRGRGPVRVASETQSPRTTLLTRLGLLGASDDEIAAVDEHWDDFDEDWTPAKRDGLIRANDTVLRAMIEAVRDEYDLGTMTAAQVDGKARQVRGDQAMAEARGRIGGTIGAIVEWVGDDAARAAAIVELEMNREGANRVTLLDHMEPIAQGWVL